MAVMKNSNQELIHYNCDFKILNLILENLIVQVCFVCINLTIFLTMIWFIKKFKQYYTGCILSMYMKKYLTNLF